MNSTDRFVVGAALGFLITMAIAIAEGVQGIERKLDAMNTCGTAEVVVSGEGE